MAQMHGAPPLPGGREFPGTVVVACDKMFSLFGPHELPDICTPREGLERRLRDIAVAPIQIGEALTRDGEVLELLLVDIRRHRAGPSHRPTQDRLPRGARRARPIPGPHSRGGREKRQGSDPAGAMQGSVEQDLGMPYSNSSCVCGISTAYYAALRVRRGVRAALCAERRAGLDGRVGPGAEGGRFLPQHLTCLLGRPGVAPREGTGLLANGLFFSL